MAIIRGVRDPKFVVLFWWEHKVRPKICFFWTYPSSKKMYGRDYYNITASQRPSRVSGLHSSASSGSLTRVWRRLPRVSIGRNAAAIAPAAATATYMTRAARLLSCASHCATNGVAPCDRHSTTSVAPRPTPRMLVGYTFEISFMKFRWIQLVLRMCTVYVQ